MLRFAVTEPTSHHLPDRYRVTGILTRDMLLEFHQKLLDGLYIEGFVTGNFYPLVGLLHFLGVGVVGMGLGRGSCIKTTSLYDVHLVVRLCMATFNSQVLLATIQARPFTLCTTIAHVLFYR